MTVTGVVAASAHRREELAEALAHVRTRISDATRAAGRQDEPTLIVVTKFFPVSDLVALADLGVMDVGENREQELIGKVESLKHERPDLLSSPRRHFIGQVQSKKAKRVARYADVVQSLDRPKLTPLLASAAAERGTRLSVFIQVDLEEESTGRGGARPAEIEQLAAGIVDHDSLELAGLMAVAPLGEDPRRAFDRLACVREGFLRRFPAATALSAGMSADLETAVDIGATHLRVGGAILGSRPAAG